MIERFNHLLAFALALFALPFFLRLNCCAFILNFDSSLTKSRGLTLFPSLSAITSDTPTSMPTTLLFVLILSYVSPVSNRILA